MKTKFVRRLLCLLGQCVVILSSDATEATRGTKIVVSTTKNTTAIVDPPTNNTEAAATPVVNNKANLTVKNKKLRICILVEPSPFTYSSGVSTRFLELLHHLESRKDVVQVVTAEVVHPDPPKEWLGFPVHYTFGITLPYFYSIMSLSADISLKAARVIARMKPDLIHVSSPGFLVLGAILWSRLFQIPLISR